MNNQAKSAAVLITLSGLLILSSGYLFQLQNWLVFNAANSSKSNNNKSLSTYGSLGIRSIVTNETNADSFKLAVSTQFEGQIEGVENMAPYIKPNEYESDREPLNSVNRVNAEVNDLNRLSDSKSDNSLPRPLVVELEDELLIEFSDKYDRREMQKIISRILIVPNSLNLDQVLSAESMDTAIKPVLYKRVLNQHKKPVRYPAQAYRYAEYLMLNELSKVYDEQGGFFIVKVPLSNVQLPQKAQRYKVWINQFSEKNNISPELVLAIIDVESNFNHRAVSKSNALGLMQIKANAAGRDVYQLIDGRQGQPSKTELFNPKENIRLGTAYVGLLQHNYLKNIKNPEKKELLTISSYNGGITSVLELFDKNPKKAINKINQLHPKQVYRTLRYKHQSEETKRYLEKVLNAKHLYTELLDLTA